MMKRTLRFPIFLAAAAALTAVGLLAAEPAQTFQIDPANSSVGFSIRHLISRVQGQFNQFSGSIQADPKDPAASSVQFTIQAASIDTHVEMRDKDLRSASFFDADKYPTTSRASGSSKRRRRMRPRPARRAEGPLTPPRASGAEAEGLRGREEAWSARPSAGRPGGLDRRPLLGVRWEQKERP
jgi:hypothetical protein